MCMCIATANPKSFSQPLDNMAAAQPTNFAVLISMLFVSLICLYPYQCLPVKQYHMTLGCLHLHMNHSFQKHLRYLSLLLPCSPWIPAWPVNVAGFSGEDQNASLPGGQQGSPSKCEDNKGDNHGYDPVLTF